MFRPLHVFLGLAMLAGAVRAQSLYEVDAFGTMTWDEFTGPPVACGYPSGPLLASFPYQQPVPCFMINPIPAGTIFGDVTDNMMTDRVYVTDGKAVAEYAANTGVQSNVMPVAGVFGTQPLTGLGYNSLANVLWLTDGGTVFGVTPSAPGSCAAPAPAFAPFPHVGPGLATDVTWVPAFGIVAVCDTQGFVTGYTPGGAVAIPPYFAGGACGLGVGLTGIAADTATGCASPQVVSLTNGVGVSRINRFTGAPVAPTFYQTATCGAVPMPFTAGLAYAARPIHYGVGSGPTLGAKGQSCLPNPGFALTLSGGPAAGNAFLLVGATPACPSLTLLGQPLYLFPIASIIGPFPVVGGTLTLPAALGPPSATFPCGLSVYAQWFVKSSTGIWKSSNGLEFSFSLP